jgi:hypothetical protein
MLSVRGQVRVSARMGYIIEVRDTVHVVAGGIVGVMSPAVTARKAEESHCGHAGGSENHGEDVKIHLY